MYTRGVVSSAVRIMAALVLFSAAAFPQKISKLDRGRALDMLHTVSADIREHYFDPDLKGVDWNAAVAEAEKRIDESPSFEMAVSYVAATLDALNDSHTNFYPPGRSNYYDYGWEYQMIGDRCFVTHVRPGSDAEKKGVKPGDEVLTVNGFMPERATLWKMRYVFNVLRPQRSVRLLVQSPVDGKSRELTVNTRLKPLKRSTDLTLSWQREYDDFRDYLHTTYVEMGQPLVIVKMPIFDLENASIGTIIGKAQNHSTMILDLRGNGGGSVETLKFLVGALFEKDIKIGDRITRKKTEPMMAKTQRTVFTGKLIVLVDAESASASELLARVVQIEKRGTVIGDVTSGSVMECQRHPNRIGGDTVWFYGETITDADLVMTDGKHLEHVGVVPDEKMLPSGLDLANGQDPVLAHAAQLAGVTLAPEVAGRMFPYQWRPDPQ